MLHRGVNSQRLYEKLEAYFKPDDCSDVFSKGLQHDNTDTVRFVYTSTFTGPEVFDFLKKEDARECLLFTHHPIPQRQGINAPPAAISESELCFLKENKISLFTYHIPLDKNGLYSPSNCLAAALSAEPYGEFYFQDNVFMGVLCRSEHKITDELLAALEGAIGHKGKLYPYGDKELENGSFAVMAGGASDESIYAELRQDGVNTLVTGMTNPSIEWLKPVHAEARKNKVNLIGATHYSSEKFSLISITGFFEDCGLPSRFIPETPRLEEL